MTTISRRRFIALAATATALGPAAPAPPIRWQGYALGAEVSLTLHAPETQARAAISGIRTLLTHVEHQFSLYDPSSALSRLNRNGQLDHPDRTFLELVNTARAVHDATGGLFDPTVQPLWSALARGDDPTQARRAIGFGKVAATRSRITLAPGQALTFNGIAQGYATDLARAVLTSRGFTRALVNIGEFAALGGPFRLGIADPAAGIAATRILTDRAIATSSPAALHLAGGSAHILDPLGRARPRWSTVSVEARSAAIADAASTAFCLMSPGNVRAALRRLPGAPLATLVAGDGTVTTLGAG